mmetsp:Transcript_938/g.1535  ORF Transcript_938/g.1535 Transcript_938/m.1535 type:complete len:206 (-) Transcript_938:85-702(-)
MLQQHGHYVEAFLLSSGAQQQASCETAACVSAHVLPGSGSAIAGMLNDGKEKPSANMPSDRFFSSSHIEIALASASSSILSVLFEDSSKSFRTRQTSSYEALSIPTASLMSPFISTSSNCKSLFLSCFLMRSRIVSASSLYLLYFPSTNRSSPFDIVPLLSLSPIVIAQRRSLGSGARPSSSVKIVRSSSMSILESDPPYRSTIC